MEEWRTHIRCYRTPGPTRIDKIAEWYVGLSSQGRADADELIKDMRRIPLRDWKMPQYRRKLQNGDGLGELRWKSEKTQQRLLGFVMKGIWYAVMGCTHKQQAYSPPDAIETAKRRKRQIERGEVDTVDYDL